MPTERGHSTHLRAQHELLTNNKHSVSLSNIIQPRYDTLVFVRGPLSTTFPEADSACGTNYAR